LIKDLGKNPDGHFRKDNMKFEGDFGLCLDNGFSAISDKTVFIEVIKEVING